MPKLLSTIKRYIGKSTERKATDCENGSTFFEADTGNMYIWVRQVATEAGEWVLKDEAGIILRLEIKYLLDELLIEAKKSNEFLEVIGCSVAG